MSRSHMGFGAADIMLEHRYGALETAPTRAIIPHGPTSAIVPHGPTRAIVPHGPTAAIVPHAQMRALIPHPEKRAIVNVDSRKLDSRMTDQRTMDQRAVPQLKITKNKPEPEPRDLAQANRWQAVRRAGDEFKQLVSQAMVNAEPRKHWSLKVRKNKAGQIVKEYINPAQAFVFSMPLNGVLQKFGTQAMNIATKHGTSVTALTIYPDDGGAPLAMVAFSDDPSIVHRKYADQIA